MLNRMKKVIVEAINAAQEFYVPEKIHLENRVTGRSASLCLLVALFINALPVHSTPISAHSILQYAIFYQQVKP